VFNDFTISGSGLYVNRKWMDALSDNIANLNTATSTDKPAFQERFIQATAANVGGSGGGVTVSGVQLGSAEGRITYDPTNPLADKNGNVKLPDMNLSDQMTNLIIAQRGYEANLNSIQRARDAYQAALQLGK
jgi:flagellar basal-body rod protein FlgC